MAIGGGSQVHGSEFMVIEAMFLSCFDYLLTFFHPLGLKIIPLPFIPRKSDPSERVGG